MARVTAEDISTREICLMCLARKIIRNWVAGSISRTFSSVRATVIGRGLVDVVIENSAIVIVDRDTRSCRDYNRSLFLRACDQAEPLRKQFFLQ